jgi:putative transposase
MGALLKFTQAAMPSNELPLAISGDAWSAAPAGRRAKANAMLTLLSGLDAELGAELVARGLREQILAGQQGLAEYTATAVTAQHAGWLRGGAAGAKVASVSTLKRAILAYRKKGKEGLLLKHTGRVRYTYGWEGRAVAAYNAPSKPGYADVASRLRQEGFAEATESRVKRYLERLPATLGKNSPARVGPHLHKLKHQKFQRRSLDEVLVGEIYAGDGHTCDCYVAHPNTGKPFRPELTAFICIKSSILAGWWFSESESKESTLFALSHAMRSHDHVPAWVYVDRGPGYRARLLSDEATGFYSRMDIGLIGALPGNPHGKGWIERFFRTVRDKHDKFFAGGAVYCGDDMAPETNRRMSAELAQGKRELPSLAQYVQSFRAWLEHYHMEPQDKLNGRTPAQVWAELVPIAVELDAHVVIRPHETATVTRQTVRLHNRFYFAEMLALYDGKKLTLEYDLHDDKRVWVFDDKGRLITEAKLTGTVGVLPTSRLEEGRDRRAAGQRKRLARKLSEVDARRADPITADSQLHEMPAIKAGGVELLPAAPKRLPKPSAPAVDIDLLNWRKDA